MAAGADTGFSTRQVHAGSATAPAAPRATPIYLTAGFTFSDLDESAAHFGTGAGFGYSRTGNPTVQAVEERLAALEGGDQAVLVSSGQAAVTVALLALAGAGDHVVASEHIYEGTRGLLLDNLARLGIDTTFVDVSDLDAVRAAVTPRTKALFAETLSNARNDVLDVAAVAAVGAESGIPLVVDSTFTTPYLLRPIEHGAASSCTRRASSSPARARFSAASSSTTVASTPRHPVTSSRTSCRPTVWAARALPRSTALARAVSTSARASRRGSAPHPRRSTPS